MTPASDGTMPACTSFQEHTAITCSAKSQRCSLSCVKKCCSNDTLSRKRWITSGWPTIHSRPPLLRLFRAGRKTDGYGRRELLLARLDRDAFPALGQMKARIAEIPGNVFSAPQCGQVALQIPAEIAICRSTCST